MKTGWIVLAVLVYTVLVIRLYTDWAHYYVRKHNLREKTKTRANDE